MSQPANVPDGCPRKADELGVGPRRCPFAGRCPLHLHTGGTRGPGPSVARLRRQMLLDDTCTLDVVERARASAHELTWHEIATLSGVSHSTVIEDANRALNKVRKILGVKPNTHARA